MGFEFYNEPETPAHEQRWLDENSYHEGVLLENVRALMQQGNDRREVLEAIPEEEDTPETNEELSNLYEAIAIYEDAVDYLENEDNDGRVWPNLDGVDPAKVHDLAAAIRDKAQEYHDGSDPDAFYEMMRDEA